MKTRCFLFYRTHQWPNSGIL